MTADGTARGALLSRVPISVRLGTAFAAVVVLVLAVLCTLFWFGLGELLRQEIDRSLVTAAQALERPGSRLTELEPLDEAEQAVVLSAFHVVAGGTAWELLRCQRDLDVEAAAEVMRRTVRRIVPTSGHL